MDSPGGHPFATASAWSLICVIAGGILAVQLVPAQQLFLHDALRPAALAQTTGLLAGVLLAALRNPASLFRTEHALSFGIFYWLLLDLLLGQGGVGQASREAVIRSFMAITLFASGIWIGSIFIAAHARRVVGASALTRDLSAGFLFGAAIVSGILGMARVAVGCGLNPSCMIDAFYQPRFSAVWFQIDAFGNLDTLFLYSRYFGFLVLPLTVALIMREGRVSGRALLALTLSFVSVAFMVGDGGRKDVGTVVGASLLVWAVMTPRVALRQLIGISALAGVLVLVMQFMLVARGVGIAEALESESEISLSRQKGPVGTVDRNFRYLANIIELVPDRLPHNGWQGVAFAATLWVPGGLVPREWQVRSIDVPREMGLRYGPGYTWTCSAIGDLYLIGGLPVVVLGGLLFGVLARGASGWLMRPAHSRKPILYALITMTLFLSLRALHELFVTGFIVVAFLCFLALRRIFAKQVPSL